jgi:hypothetical protein
MVKMFSNVTPTTSFSKAHVQPKKLFGGRIIASGEDGGISVADAGLLTGFLQRDVSNVLVTLLFRYFYIVSLFLLVDRRTLIRSRILIRTSN